jgi:hypothetical protein
MKSDRYEPTNVGNPQEVTILEFTGRVGTLMGVTTPNIFEPLPEDDPKQGRPDLSKAWRVLGWEPKINLEEGLKITLESACHFFWNMLPIQTPVLFPLREYEQRIRSAHNFITVRRVANIRKHGSRLFHLIKGESSKCGRLVL